MRLIDVTVPLDAQLPTYPHNTPFTLEPIKRIARGDSSNVSTLHISAHSGTHVDAPRHFFDEGTGTEALPLELLVGRTRVIEVSSRAGITAEDLDGIDFSDDIRVLIEGLDLRDVDPGIYEMFCLPLRIVGSDGAPARVVLRRS
jgi:arylformamidase